LGFIHVQLTLGGAGFLDHKSGGTWVKGHAPFICDPRQQRRGRFRSSPIARSRTRRMSAMAS